MPHRLGREDVGVLQPEARQRRLRLHLLGGSGVVAEALVRLDGHAPAVGTRRAAHLCEGADADSTGLGCNGLASRQEGLLGRLAVIDALLAVA